LTEHLARQAQRQFFHYLRIHSGDAEKVRLLSLASRRCSLPAGLVGAGDVLVPWDLISSRSTIAPSLSGMLRRRKKPFDWMLASYESRRSWWIAYGYLYMGRAWTVSTSANQRTLLQRPAPLLAKETQHPQVSRACAASIQAWDVHETSYAVS